jgi:hypothetical protein
MQRAIELLSALLTPITAVLALRIGWRQNQLQREAVRLQLYDRRAAIYRAYLEYLTAVVHGGGDPGSRLRLGGLLAEAPFLFEPADAEHLSEVVVRGVDEVGEGYPRRPEEVEDPAERAEIIRWMAEERAWYYSRLREAPDRFRRYLGAP